MAHDATLILNSGVIFGGLNNISDPKLLYAAISMRKTLLAIPYRAVMPRMEYFPDR